MLRTKIKKQQSERIRIMKEKFNSLFDEFLKEEAILIKNENKTALDVSSSLGKQIMSLPVINVSDKFQDTFMPLPGSLTSMLQQIDLGSIPFQLASVNKSGEENGGDVYLSKGFYNPSPYTPHKEESQRRGNRYRVSMHVGKFLSIPRTQYFFMY